MFLEYEKNKIRDEQIETNIRAIYKLLQLKNDDDYIIFRCQKITGKQFRDILKRIEL
jgi:hypothetical protein